jgi:rapamycin-insensitive companion of mTOR
MDLSDRSRQDVDLELESRATGVAPPHFYRELTRTAEGCKLLEESGHFLEFVSTIRNFWAEKDDQEIVLKVKGCLWAVGNVGSMELGASFLEESDVIQWIVKMAESSEVVTLRGTAVFVLGLISRSLHGLELLNEFGWDSKTTMLGQSLGLCIPGSIHKLFSVCYTRFPTTAVLSDPF